MGVWGSEWLGQDPEVLSQEIPSAVESEPDTFQNTLGAHQAISSPPFPSSSTGWSTGFGTKQAWTRRHLTSLSLGPPPCNTRRLLWAEPELQWSPQHGRGLSLPRPTWKDGCQAF